MNCALTILLLNISRGHDASCPYILILFALWVVIIVYVFYITLKNPSFVE